MSRLSDRRRTPAPQVPCGAVSRGRVPGARAERKRWRKQSTPGSRPDSSRWRQVASSGRGSSGRKTHAFSRVAAATRMTSSSRACCTPRSCAVLTPAPRSPPSRRHRSGRAVRRARGLHVRRSRGCRGQRRPERGPPRHSPLAHDVVCFVGDPVVLVVAESRALAEDACELVTVEYEPRPAVLDLWPAVDDDRRARASGAGFQRCPYDHVARRPRARCRVRRSPLTSSPRRSVSTATSRCPWRPVAPSRAGTPPGVR